MSKTIDFIFDFGSPNAYLAYRALPGVLERSGAELNLVPCLLGGIFKATGNQSPVQAFAPVKGKLEYFRIEIMRFVKKHGLDDFAFNPNFPVNTLMMMRGAIAAEMDGRLDDYVEAGMRQMWEQELKMDDPDVFAAAMTDAGFDGPALLERIQEPEVKAKLINNTAAAVDRGTFGIPTFYVGDEMYFGKDRLLEVEEAAS
ncbi:MAG: 2-hydroxychromene-2-carboxylate isomerase [Rhizobiaceae bacterium]|nr:2-hydroxychromene-2-carboxylate isomerase [Hyphomicrobiales bacterium]NRB33117.1 2-hydroxychromene-2-carboxylate isomerase [Rhizobiaceae bacterium]